eukprot:gene1573-956_t
MYAEGSLPSSDRQHLTILYWRAVFTPESDDHSGAFTRRRTKLTECILRASYAVQHLPVEPTGVATERCPVSFSVLSSALERQEVSEETAYQGRTSGETLACIPKKANKVVKGILHISFH